MSCVLREKEHHSKNDLGASDIGKSCFSLTPAFVPPLCIPASSMSGVGSKCKDNGGILTQKPRGVCLLVVLFLAECVVWVEGDPGGGAPPFLLTESEEPAAPPAGWVCSTCGRGYASLAELRTHWSEHARGRHVCGVCGASYSVQSSLARHIRTDHAQRRKVFACPLCGSTFKHNFSRNLHLRTVHRLDIPNTKRGDARAPPSP